MTSTLALVVRAAPGNSPCHARTGFFPTVTTTRTESIMISTILLVILILLLIGALPTWPHSRAWGYYPSGGLGLVVVILLVLLLLGYI
jgi:Protein of unknown function (DUF3309)